MKDAGLYFAQLHRAQRALTQTARELGAQPKVNRRYMILWERAARIRRIAQGIMRRALNRAWEREIGRAA